jgi:asparagine synthase (glutamine-hydrolysing)
LTRTAGDAVGAYDAAHSRLERLQNSTDHWLSTIQDLDMRHYLPLDILTKVDRMSMAHSLESRVPLLDHPFVEFAATIPPDLKLHQGKTKYAFVQALRGWVPDAVLDRPKKGFGVPLGTWFRGSLKPMVRELLLSESVRRRGVLEPSFLERLVARHDSGRPMELQLWTLMSLELWCRTFLDQPARVAPVERVPATVLRHRGRRPVAVSAPHEKGL